MYLIYCIFYIDIFFASYQSNFSKIQCDNYVDYKYILFDVALQSSLFLASNISLTTLSIVFSALAVNELDSDTFKGY